MHNPETVTQENKKSVQVLLSAFQGETYLPQQLDSILAQRGVHVSLLIRDDGSHDGTWRILTRYAQSHTHISIYRGANLGAAASFFDLLLHAGPEADYYAFADQDDVWRKDKLFRAVSRLEAVQKEAHRQPLLYAGNVICASEDLQKRTVFRQVERAASFGNALAENICMGCTEVFNRQLLELVQEHRPDGNVLHDWWMYLTAAYFGSVVYDQRACMLYRQHGNNQIGMQHSQAARWKHRIRQIGRLRCQLSDLAEMFRKAYEELLDAPVNAYGKLPDAQACEELLDTSVNAYEELPDASVQQQIRKHAQNAESLEQLCGYRNSWKNRLRLVTSKNIYRQHRLDDVIYRLLFLLGYL